MRDHPPEEFYSHSENRQNKWNLLREHLEEVATRAREFAESFGAGEQAYIAGLLHDLGKYGDLFQKRLKGEGKGLDHWSVGAGYCLKLFGDASSSAGNSRSPCGSATS